MATPDPPDFPMNSRPRNPKSLSQFIRMRRVVRKGQKKSNLGIKKLINRFENRVTAMEKMKIEGSIVAPPSASAPPYQDDSDCESWGSDFSDDENKEDISWEPQEEIENDINDMLEAAMERKKNLENSTLGGNEVAQGQPSASNAHLPPEQLAFSAEPGAPPLPPRNPPGVLNASPVNSRENKTSAANSVPSRGLMDASVNPPSGGTSKIPAVPQTKSLMQVIVPTVSRIATTSIPSTSGIGNNTSHTPEGPTSSDLPRQTTSEQDTPTFPPDVTIFHELSTSSRLRLRLSVIRASGRRSPVPRGADKSSNGDAFNMINDSHVGNPPDPKLLQPQLTKVSSQPDGTNKISTRPPLPLRPPPVGPRLHSRLFKNRPTHPDSAASAPKSKNDAAPEQEITQVNKVKKHHPGPPLSNTVATLQIPKGASSSQTNLAEQALQNPPSSESPKHKSRNSEQLLALHTVRLPEKPDPKSKSIALGVPKIIKELDAAVLKQVTPKKRNKSGSVGQLENSLNENRRSLENSAKAEDANSPSDEYLNPKEMSAEGPRFEPDRPTLPRRLKHARSLPLLNLVDTLRKDSSKNKITADVQNSVKLCLQPSQAIKETGLEFPVPNDEVFNQPWYHPVTWTQAQFKLTTMAQDGAFLVRPSSRVSQGVPFTISVFFRGRIINCHISNTPERKYVLGKMKANQKTFDTITELIRYYQSTPAELKISEAEPVSKVCLLITPPRDNDKIYADV